MNVRIEAAQVLSFRLKVPPSELQQLPAQLAEGRTLVISAVGNELTVAGAKSESYLRFRPAGTEAMLTEVVIRNDEGGLFFQNVLGLLMVRYAGDLHVRLTWSSAEHNARRELREVRISRGNTSYPGLTNALAAAPPSQLVSAEGQLEAPAQPENGEASPAPFDADVQDSLERARAYWEEYQRLKAAKR